MLPTPFLLSTEQRQKRSHTQNVIPFLNNIIFQYTNPLPFETEPHIIHTIPLAREPCDSHLYYIRFKTLEITPTKTPFQSIFNPVHAYISFPQVLTVIELLPFIISNTNRHAQYRDLTSFNKNHFGLINFDHSFLIEPSKRSDSRPYTTSHILSETQLEEYNPIINKEPQQFNIISC